MNHFLERLPWRIAALAGLLVGGVSLLTGADVWACLLRVGAAFLIFAVLGLVLRALLQSEAPPISRGRHFDQTAPGGSPEEAHPPASSDPGD